MYLPRVLISAPEELRQWICLNAKSPHSWASCVLNDLEWLQSHSERLKGLPSPSTDPCKWEEFVRESPKAFRRIVKKVFHEDAAHPMASNDKAAAAEAFVSCRLCGGVYASRAALAMHCTVMHGYHALSTFYVNCEGRCLFCFQQCGTPQRLQAHFEAKCCHHQLALQGYPMKGQEEMAQVQLQRRDTTRCNKLRGSREKVRHGVQF